MRLPISILLLLATSFSAISRNNSLLFIENKGQITDQFRNSRNDIDFSLSVGGFNAFVGAGVIHYQFHAPGKEAIVNSCRIDMELIGANPMAILEKNDRQAYYEHYYTPHLGEKGARANTYQRITYKEIYPQIDWILYTRDGQLQHEFLIKDGGNPADIKIRYKGTHSLNINPDGSLTASTSMGSIREHAPISIQANGKEVKTSFVLQNNIVSYELATYKGTLIIDPAIEWGTYYRGIVDEVYGCDIAKDPSGNIYMANGTRISSQVATIGAYDATYADSTDAYLVKFDSNGNRLWATYYGGISFDRFSVITCDGQGNVIVSGTTSTTTGIATSGSDQPFFIGPANYSLYFGGDAFVVKFDGAGNRLWGTYFGGPAMEAPHGIVCDAWDNIYISGQSQSDTNVATAGAHQDTTGGNFDGYLVKYNSNGQKIWSTYYGGASDDLIRGTAILGTNIYITGITRSTNNIATTGTYQSAKTPSSYYSGFIAAFDTSGVRSWGTYFAGTTAARNTMLYAVGCKASGALIVVGSTNDTTGITTTGAHQETFGGQGPSIAGDALIAMFTPTGNRIWSTYFGGEKDDWATALETNPNGDIYIAGHTHSITNIAINAMQLTHGGGPIGKDGWIAKVSDMGACIWSTYLGGAGEDGLHDIAVVSDERFYVSGGGGSFPTTTGSYMPVPVDSTNGYLADNYLARFSDYPTGVKDIEKEMSSLYLYPNPNSGTFTLTANTLSKDKVASIEITDILGKLVQTSEVRIDNGTINQKLELNSSNAPGVYFLRLRTATEEQSVRFIKK